MRRLLLAALLALLPGVALAGAGTITVKDGAGASQVFDVVTDGSGNFVAKQAVCDGTAAANCAAVKAASTAAAATDPALVVAISPNNTVSDNITKVGGAALALGQTSMSASIPVAMASDQSAVTVSLGDNSGSGTLTAVNNAVQISGTGTGSGVLQVTANTNVTLVIEGTLDAANWFTLTAYPIGGGASVTSITTTGQWGFPTAGLQNVRVRVTAIGATPSATVKIETGLGSTQVAAVVNPTAGNFKVDLSGTAANATAIKVDGSAVTQPVSGTVSITANSAVNLAQVAGATTATGHGTASGAVRVELPTDGTGLVSVAQSGTWTVQPGNTANSTPWLTTDGATSATGSAVPAKAGYVGGNASGNLTGVTVCDNWTAINQTAGAQVITGTSAKKTYICAINLVTASAQNIALVGGTGTVCATGTHAIAGGTTAATGWNLAANGGLAQGSGLGVVMQAGTAADNVCILQSASGQISGSIAWTQY